jgi:hypothetical protein
VSFNINEVQTYSFDLDTSFTLLPAVLGIYSEVVHDCFLIYPSRFIVLNNFDIPFEITKVLLSSND